jgi:hypothetical protein
MFEKPLHPTPNRPEGDSHQDLNVPLFQDIFTFFSCHIE